MFVGGEKLSWFFKALSGLGIDLDQLFIIDLFKVV